MSAETTAQRARGPLCDCAPWSRHCPACGEVAVSTYNMAFCLTCGIYTDQGGSGVLPGDPAIAADHVSFCNELAAKLRRMDQWGFCPDEPERRIAKRAESVERAREHLELELERWFRAPTLLNDAVFVCDVCPSCGKWRVTTASSPEPHRCRQ